MPIPERVQYFDFLTTSSSFLTRSASLSSSQSHQVPQLLARKLDCFQPDHWLSPSLVGRDLKEIIWFPYIASMKYWAYPVLSIQRTDG